jgi:hypothetical protein
MSAGIVWIEFADELFFSIIFLVNHQRIKRQDSTWLCEKSVGLKHTTVQTLMMLMSQILCYEHRTKV